MIWYQIVFEILFIIFAIAMVGLLISVNLRLIKMHKLTNESEKDE